MSASRLPEGLDPETLNALSVHLTHGTSMKREERLRFLAQWREARERDAEAEASGLTRQDRIALPVGHRLRLGPPA